MPRFLTLVSALLLLSAPALAQKTLYFPHWGDGGGLSMQFAFTNKSGSTAGGSLRLYAPNGDELELPGVTALLSLEPNETVVFRTDGQSDPLRSGFAIAEFSQDNVSGLAVFQLATGSEASVLPTELGSRFSLLVERKPGLDTGVAVFRPGPFILEPQQADITAKLFDQEGNLARQGPFPELDFQAARSVGEIFTDLPAEFTGSLELSCECSFAPVGLRFGSVLSTIAVTDLGSFVQDLSEIHTRHLPYGLPVGTDRSNDLIVREIYALSSDDATKFASWVAYRLDPATVDGPPQDDSNFMADPLLDPDETLEPDDYDGAFDVLGVDPGYLAPLASFVGTDHWRDTNYLSNIVPRESGLNSGGWLTVENDVRDLVRAGHEVFVITGPLYERFRDPLPEADEVHRVPSGFFKIVLVIEDEVQATAFIFDQEDRGDIQQRIVSIDEVERRSGLDFLPALEGGAEDALEAAVGVWPLP